MPPVPPMIPCMPPTSPLNAGPNPCRSPVSIDWNCEARTFDACSKVVRFLTRSVGPSSSSLKTPSTFTILFPRLITSPCNLRNSTCPVTVACLNLSTLVDAASRNCPKACSDVNVPAIKPCIIFCACGMFCTNCRADSVTGTPALAMRSWKPSFRLGARFPTVPAKPCSLLRVSSVCPCSAAWNLSLLCCCSICALSSSLCAPVNFASLSSSSANVMALLILC